MRLTGERLRLGSNGGRSNPWRMLVYLSLIVGGVFLTRLVEAGRVKPLFLATPTPTRIASSFTDEGEAYFSAGNLEEAIKAYQAAVLLEPDNADLWAELARIQTYSSDLLTTLGERRTLLAEARESIENAIRVDPDNTKALSVRALVYDWSAAAEIKDSIDVGDEVRVEAVILEGGRISARMIELAGSVNPGEVQRVEDEEAIVVFTGIAEDILPEIWMIGGRIVEISGRTIIREQNRREEFLLEADTSATRALQLSPGDPLALAFHAEVLVDQQRFAQALELAEKAAEDVSQVELKDQMDIHRVYGTVLENHGYYLLAIQEYEEAAMINPNLTFLYLYIGANYRQLQDVETALDKFDKAAKINQQLGINDPTPYLAIGKTYQQQGEFFIAAANIKSALAIDSGNADIYARLGIVYFQARNYETAIEVLKCALDGCSPSESGQLLCDLGVFFCDDIEVQEGEMEFVGRVESIASGTWIIAGKTVSITPQTEIAEGLSDGDNVIVKVFIANDDSLAALEIALVDQEETLSTVTTMTALQIGRAVSPLELGQRTKEYYYTYGSVLAAFAGHPDYVDICQDAERIFVQLDVKFEDDDLVSAIVDEGRTICTTQNILEPEITPTAIPDDSG